jgi:hypothetical protein
MKTIKTISMQAWFENRMTYGHTLTISQLKQMGFSNPYDAAYAARQKGISVKRFIKDTQDGPVSVYSLDV